MVVSFNEQFHNLIKATQSITDNRVSYSDRNPRERQREIELQMKR